MAGSTPRSISLKRELPTVTAAMDWIESHANEAGAPPKVISVLQMAIEEVLANVILHGLPTNEELEITLSWDQPAEGIVRIEIRDNGEEFNPLLLPTANIALDEDDREVGGLGVHLIRRYMDLCTYERLDGRNILALTRRLTT